MLSDLKKVIALFKYFGLKLDINKYMGRFFVQKLTYLSQALGIPTNYYFNIHIKGPYSPQLTRDYYHNQDIITTFETDYELTPNDTKVLEKIKIQVLDEKPSMQFLECLSTIIYLIRSNENIADDEVFIKIKTFKPYLSDSTIVIGRNKAKELLFKPEYLTDELKREIEEWDRIED